MSRNTEKKELKKDVKTTVYKDNLERLNLVNFNNVNGQNNFNSSWYDFAATSLRFEFASSLKSNLSRSTK